MSAAKKIALTALFAATLTAGKTATSFIPNVEPVSLLLSGYAFVFGIGVALPCALVFCLVEMLIWGVNTWVAAYFIYWPLLAVVFSFLGAKKASRWLAVITVVLSTLFFGVLTSLIDVGLFMGRFDDFWARFAVMYARGVPFFATHVLSNAALFALLFSPLTKLLEKLKNSV